MWYLSNTFSPMMLGPGARADVKETDIQNIPSKAVMKSVVSHEVTAKVLSVLLMDDVVFNRSNVKLIGGDIMYCVIPAFRASEAREFTYEEVAGAGFRCFKVTVSE